MFNDNFENYSSREDMIIRKWINNTKWLKNEVEKAKPDNTGFHDYKIWLKDGSSFIVEVKEEENYWYSKTKNIGLDYISAFYFNNRERELYWKSVRRYWVSSEKLDHFLTYDINVSKWGKLETCDADVQLFYVENKGKTVLLKAYSNAKLTDKSFKDYIRKNYALRINKKSDYNLADDWESAAFFVNPLVDKELIKCEINSFEDLKASY